MGESDFLPRQASAEFLWIPQWCKRIRKSNILSFSYNSFFTQYIQNGFGNNPSRRIGRSLSGQRQRRQRADAEALRAETEGLRRTGEDAEENARRAIQEALQNAENARTALDSERNVFISSSCDALQKSFDSMIGDIDSRYQKIKEDGGAFIKNLADRVQDTRETIALLSEGEKEKISDAVDRLNELEGKIKLSEDQLTALSEQITRTREELFTAQQERGKLDSDIAERSKELDKMQSDMQSAKAQRINEEAALVRLKLQISNLQKAGSSKDESAKKKPEEMIAEFPDDIFTGNVEDVDLSDDDENE